MTGLLTEILRFCDKHSIPHSRFGNHAVRDASFIKNMIGGRCPGHATEAKVREYMAAIDAGRTAPATEPMHRRPSPARYVKRVSAPSRHEAMCFVVDRDSCFRCGVRKDVHEGGGCREWRGIDHG